MKETPSNCKVEKCHFNQLSPPENSQECIGCHYLNVKFWQPETEITINEALISLSIQLEVKHRLEKNYEAKALKLGIEALKFFVEFQKVTGVSQDARLPGERKEKENER